MPFYINLAIFQPRHFIFPFLSHAVGTFFGAITTALIVATYKMRWALIIGCIFLIGGIINTYLLSSPNWFTIIDLLGAYIPMVWIGGKLIY